MQFTPVLLLALTATLAACTGGTTCDTATVSGVVRHHGKVIPNATVYIVDGSDAVATDKYDHKTTANAKGEYAFKTVGLGQHYLYAEGFDAGIDMAVKGGKPLQVTCLTSPTAKTDIPVTEGD